MTGGAGAISTGRLGARPVGISRRNFFLQLKKPVRTPAEIRAFFEFACALRTAYRGRTAVFSGPIKRAAHRGRAAQRGRTAGGPNRC